MDHLVDRACESLEHLEADWGVETAIEGTMEVAPTPMSERCRIVLQTVA